MIEILAILEILEIHGSEVQALWSGARSLGILQILEIPEILEMRETLALPGLKP